MPNINNLKHSGYYTYNQVQHQKVCNWSHSAFT